MCWTHWIHFKEREDIHRKLAKEQAMADSAANSRTLDLEQRLEAHISDSKTHLLKYVAKLVNTKDPAFIILLISQWRAHSHGEKSAEAQRQLELTLREQQRLHDLKVTRDKEKKLAAMEGMGFKNDKAYVMKHFLIWSAEFQKDRQKRLHAMTSSRVLGKLGTYMDAQWVKKNSKEVLLTTYQEWVRDTHHSKFERERSEFDQVRGIVQQLTQERLALAEQLTIVYQQLDSVTDTLQKELKTKEELAR